MIKRLFLALAILFITSTGYCATYVNDGNINWNGNWQVGSQVKTLHATTNLNVDSTTTQYSVAWDGNGTTVHIGCLVYLNSITTPATGRILTVTIEENIATVWTAQTSTTLTTDSTTKTASWYYFKFSGTETETVGTGNYRIKVTSDNAADTGFRADSASATNVAIICVTQATGTLAAADVTYVCGYTTAATGNPTAATVTVNVNLDGTGYGLFYISNGGVLAWGNSAAATYYLEIAGSPIIYNGGTYSMSGNTATLSTLEIDSTAAARTFTISAGAVFSATGATKFSTGTNYRCISTDNIAVVTDRTVATSIDVSTLGWAAGDAITISGTNPTVMGESETKIISSVGASSITITTDWTNTHLLGAEICNLTRNVVIKNNSASNSTSILNNNTTTGNFDCDWVQFMGLKSSGTRAGGLHFNGSTVVGTVDNCAFFTCGGSGGNQPAFYLSGSSNLSFTNLVFWNNGVGAWFHASNNARNNTITGFSGIKASDADTGINLLSGASISTGSAHSLKMVNCNFYDRTPSSSSINLAVLDGIVEVNNCKFWGIRSTGNTGTAIAAAAGTLFFRNSTFGSDGTNIMSNGSSDITYAPSSRYSFHNCLFNNTTAYWTTPLETANMLSYVTSHNHNQVQYRYKSQFSYGIISDQQTGGQAATWARGGAGTCVYLDPSSTTAGNTLNWEFYIPVTAATDPTIKFYVKTTQTVSGPTLNLDVYDSNNDNTLLVNNASIDLTGSSDWTQYSVASISPTSTGYVRCVLKALNGASTGDVGVDDISVVISGTTATDALNNWKDGLPQLQFDRGGGAASCNDVFGILS